MPILASRRAALTCLAATGMLVGLPLAGVWLAGHDVGPYLEFPPLTRYVEHPDYSRTAFVALALLFGAALAALAWAVSHGRRRQPPLKGPAPRADFPWWGWLGLALGLASWGLAWTRFPCFALLQRHTFTPLWLAYIVVINALCRWRGGHCLLLEQPGRFLLLFPVSAGFWWFFEYLNRFVQNWYYLGVEGFSAGQYVLLASLSFSTVLPAVLSTRDLLLTWPAIGRGLRGGRQVDTTAARPTAVMALALAGAGLALIGVLPHLLFPLLWISPLLIAWALQVLCGRSRLLAALAAGDWRDVVAGPLAGLICGFFWEMWNFWSLAKWEYAVPFIDRYHLFEMPVLGFAGYLPFGLECLVLGELVRARTDSLGDAAQARSQPPCTQSPRLHPCRDQGTAAPSPCPSRHSAIPGETREQNAKGPTACVLTSA